MNKSSHHQVHRYYRQGNTEQTITTFIPTGLRSLLLRKHNPNKTPSLAHAMKHIIIIIITACTVFVLDRFSEHEDHKTKATVLTAPCVCV